ncbi:hypothetical protein ACFXB3_00540 [Streptomyces sp. NPDC059447]|uniref:hypothetical protein n=1 Tax=Streptomyces sp. NPDC059447 TaxID=3346834 RepID=UPI003696C468
MPAQTGRQVLGGMAGQLRGGELRRQGDALEVPADVPRRFEEHRRPVPRPPRCGCRGAAEEQRKGFLGPERRQFDDVFTGDAQGLAARGQYGEPRRDGQQVGGQGPYLGNQVLARVEDEEQAAADRPGAQGLRRLACGVVGETARGHDGVDQHGRVR